MSPTALSTATSTPTSPRATVATPRRATSWLPVGLALFAVAWGGNQFTPLLVMYRETGGFSLATVDVLLGAYVLGIVPGMLVGGPLSDRWALAYTGFLMPAVLAVASVWLPYPVLFGVGAVAALACLALRAGCATVDTERPAVS